MKSGNGRTPTLGGQTVVLATFEGTFAEEHTQEATLPPQKPVNARSRGRKTPGEVGLPVLSIVGGQTHSTELGQPLNVFGFVLFCTGGSGGIRCKAGPPPAV